MPQKTRKEKQTSQLRKVGIASSSVITQKQSAEPLTTTQSSNLNNAFHNKEETQYFMADLKKSLAVIICILCIEGGLYWAVQTHIIRFIQ